ncbi:hypothetical protein DL98DRAFT_526937 [Cadophora sp. DSE1049]|nr:hypothetical protein DL98DRAFT_526937 [Cadophora sp. DSE1049]
MTALKKDVVAVAALARAPRELNGVAEEEVSDHADFEEEAEEFHVPSLEEDMANNPGRTREEVKYARGLWASVMLEIHNSVEDEEEHPDDEEYSGDFGPHSRVFVAKAPIRAIAKRFQELAPHDRSWPILEWRTIIEPANFGYWHRIDVIMKFVYRGEFNTGGPESYFNTTEGDIVNWCPTMQNISLKAIMKRDAAMEQALDAYGDDQIAILGVIADDSAYTLEKIGTVHKGDGEFETHKLMSYMIDRLIWDALNGCFAYLKVVHRGNCTANMVARAHIDAAKKPKPRFAPWHVFNRHRYLVSEEFKADKKRLKVADGREKSKKQRVS